MSSPSFTSRCSLLSFCFVDHFSTGWMAFAGEQMDWFMSEFFDITEVIRDVLWLGLDRESKGFTQSLLKVDTHDYFKYLIVDCQHNILRSHCRAEMLKWNEFSGSRHYNTYCNEFSKV